MVKQTRREFLHQIGAAGISAAAISALPGCAKLGQIASAGIKRPNVIVILSDDQGYAHLGCYGDTYTKDQLSEETLAKFALI